MVELVKDIEEVEIEVEEVSFEEQALVSWILDRVDAWGTRGASTMSRSRCGAVTSW